MLDIKELDKLLIHLTNVPKNAPQKFLTLIVLENILTGKSPLLPKSVLKNNPNVLSQNELLSLQIQQIFSLTDIDPFSGNKPLLKPGTGKSTNKNKITALCNGKFFQCYHNGTSPSCGGNRAWMNLRDRFFDPKNTIKILEQILCNLKVLSISEHFTDSVQKTIHDMFRYLHAQPEYGITPDLALCLREISMLFVEALLGNDLYNGICASWVSVGFVTTKLPQPLTTHGSEDSLAHYFNSCIFSISKEEIRDELLPDIMVNHKKLITSKKQANGTYITPLEQILEEHTDQKLFLLCGDENSSSSGAGKTTSLRKLYYNYEPQAPVFVPLSAVYSTSSLRSFQRENGRPRLLTWLNLKGLRFDSLAEMAPRLFLMDGLDEIIDPRGLEALCDDLCSLSDLGIRMIISSKLPPNRLSSWEFLRSITSVWSGCTYCYIQPLRAEQIRTYLQDASLSLSLSYTLKTPFLVHLYKEVQLYQENIKTAPPPLRPNAIYSRWLPYSKGTLDLHDETPIIYRALIVQICRWFDSNSANDVQNEADAFFLMYALPTIAFQMEVHKLYDPEFTPLIREVDDARVEQLLSQSFPAFKRALTQYPAYQNNIEFLFSNSNALDNTTFHRGQAVTVLPRELDCETLEYRYKFVNRAVQENLPALHLANIFFTAYHKKLDMDDSLLDFYICPIYFMPENTFEKTIHFLNDFFNDSEKIFNILKSDPEKDKEGRNPLSQYLLCNLAAAMCGALKLSNPKKVWLTAAVEAYKTLSLESPSFAAHYGIDYVLNLCNLAQALRTENPADAAKKARSAIEFYNTHSDLKNSDGFHSLAMVYMEQVQAILNQTQPENLGDYIQLIPNLDLDFSSACQIHQELSRLTQLVEQGSPPTKNSSVFGPLLAKNLELTRPLLDILDKSYFRMHAYQKEGLLANPILKFLLTASYTAKAHSVYAAFSQGTSGAALNMLACFLENNQEELENSSELPFFQHNPLLHLEISSKQLEYSNHHCSAFLLYRRIYSIHRGPQPYSARKLAEALLARRVRLDEQDQPVEGANRPYALTDLEYNFLDEVTQRACIRHEAGYSMPRIRYLNEQMSKTGVSDKHSPSFQEAQMLFQREWKLCKCQDKVRIASKVNMDFYTVKLIAEYRDGYLEHANIIDWPWKSCTFFREALNVSKKYIIGTHMCNEYLKEALLRLCQLGNQFSSFKNLPSQSSRWSEIFAGLDL